jgi:hypothetical protein
MNQTAVTTAPGGGPAAAASPQPYRRRLRNYLVDANLQLRLASYLVGVAAAIQVTLGVLLWRAYQETSAVIALADPAIGQLMAQEDRRRMLWVTIGFALVVVAMLSLALVVTHRVAGPAFYLARSCRKVGEGRYHQLRPLRKRDLLVPLADEVGLMIEALRDREAKERAALGAMAARLRRPGASPDDLECAEAMEALAAEKARRIGA